MCSHIFISEEIKQWHPEPGEPGKARGPWGPRGDMFSCTAWRRAADGESDRNKIPGASLSPGGRPLLTCAHVFLCGFRVTILMCDFTLVFISTLI